MGGMRTHGTAAELEVKRMIAGKLLLEGKGVSEVARLVGASTSSVSRWKQTVKKKRGLEGLKAKPHPGKPCCLAQREKNRLITILKRGPRKAGYATDLWTCQRVAEVIDREFGVRYHPDHVGKLLRRLGYSPQKPEQRAREQDEQAIARWRRREWPRIKKGRRRAS